MGETGWVNTTHLDAHRHKAHTDHVDDATGFVPRADASTVEQWVDNVWNHHGNTLIVAVLLLVLAIWRVRHVEAQDRRLVPQGDRVHLPATG